MSRKRKITFLAICILCGLTSWPTPAEATLITIGIEGVVNKVKNDGNFFKDRVNPGDLITGTYSYDTDTPDSNPLTYIARYEHFDYPYGISLSAGGLDFRTDPANTDFVIGMEDRSPNYYDYSVRSWNILPLWDNTPGFVISWTLRDHSATALSSIELLTTAPVLDDWKDNFFIIDVKGEGSRGDFIVGDIISAVVIPEPASILLLGLGGLVFTQRTKK